MITKNFKNIFRGILASATTSNGNKGLLPIKAESGVTVYSGGCFAGNTSCFPYYVSESLSTANNSAGYQFGTGTTPATEDDYILASRINSGLSISSVSQILTDENGNVYKQVNITVTNTSNANITISEIGYCQRYIGWTTLNGTSNAAAANQYFLLDRTVLDEPVTIESKGFAVIQYILKTIIA